MVYVVNVSVVAEDPEQHLDGLNQGPPLFRVNLINS